MTSITPTVERTILVISLITFAAALHLSHDLYLQPSWEYLGITYATPSLTAYALGAALIGLAGLLMPSRFEAPSSVFLMALAFIVYVPTVVITLALRADAIEAYGANLLALALAFGGACLVCRRDSAKLEGGNLPDGPLVWGLLAAWTLATIATIAMYSDTLRLVGFGGVYEQREAGAATSIVAAYLQTYYLNVVCPAVLAVGLLDRRRPWMIIVGLAGFLLTYAVAAQKAALFLPFVMLGAYAAMTTAGRLLGLSATVALVLTSAIALGTAMYLEGGSNWFAAIVIHRTIAIPGLTLSQYVDFFGEVGYTFWSHVRVVSLLVPPPPSLADNPLWPNLGYLIGEHTLGDTKLNVNANLFASDGVAAAGPLGIIAIGGIFAIWLSALDRAGRGWDRRFVALVLLPVAISLTNGPLFTVLLSFGGFFWTVLLFAYKPSCQAMVPADEEPPKPPATIR